MFALLEFFKILFCIVGVFSFYVTIKSLLPPLDIPMFMFILPVNIAFILWYNRRKYLL
jgi:hypothetical protein